MSLPQSLLRGERVSKRFGGVQALNDVSFSINARDIYGLIGPNGAGKTTLFNVLTGIYQPDVGSFNFAGRSLAGLKPNHVAEAGIARTFQNIRLFTNLSALENVMIGRHSRGKALVAEVLGPHGIHRARVVATFAAGDDPIDAMACAGRRQPT